MLLFLSPEKVLDFDFPLGLFDHVFINLDGTLAVAFFKLLISLVLVVLEDAVTDSRKSVETLEAIVWLEHPARQ